MRLGLLSNCRAGLKRDHLGALGRVLKAAPDVVHIETAGSEEVPEALAHLARQEVTLLAVNGGDGTLQHVLTEVLSSNIFETLPCIAPLCGGRTNMSAHDIGSRGRPATGLAALISSVQTNTLAQRIVERPVLRMECGPHQRPQYGMFFGAGVIQRAIAFKHQLYPQQHLQGPFGAGLFLGGMLLRIACGSQTGLLTPDEIGIGLHAEHGEQYVNDERVPLERLERERFQLLMATTLERLILSIRPFWGREDAAVRFTSIASGAKRSLPAVLKILRGRPPAPSVGTSGYCSRNVERVILHMDSGFTIDGELFDPEPGRTLRLEADRRLRFVRA